MEIKSSNSIQSHHLKGLRAIHEDHPTLKRIVVSLDHRQRLTDDNITIYPWKSFLEELWAGNIKY